MWPSGEQVIDELERLGNPILLAFSCGKDSLACWLKLRWRVEVVPVYRYLVPGLEFVQESIDYYERSFGVKIHQVPHDSLYRWLRNLTFQAPENCHLIEEACLPKVGRDDWRGPICEQLGLPIDTWCAVGTRANDSPYRRMAFDKKGPWHEKDRTVYPCWDMDKAGVVDTIKASGIMLPPEYRVFGRSFDGLDFRFLYGIRKHWPRDYQRILDCFPLAELEIKRYEFANARSIRLPRNAGTEAEFSPARLS